MPGCVINSNVQLTKEQALDVCKQFSKQIGAILSKPETYVQVQFQNPQAMLFGGSDAPAAYIVLTAIGTKDAKKNKALSKAFCDILHVKCNIPADRVYSSFTYVSGSDWGWNGETF